VPCGSFDERVDCDYKEEIAAEGLTRSLPAFADFLESAALADGRLVNYSTIARLEWPTQIQLPAR